MPHCISECIGEFSYQYNAVGCVTLYTGVPKVIKCMLHGAQLMSLVINDSPSEKNLKILHFLIWTKAFEVYLLLYVVAVPDKNVFAKKSYLP